MTQTGSRLGGKMVEGGEQAGVLLLAFEEARGHGTLGTVGDAAAFAGVSNDARGERRIIPEAHGIAEGGVDLEADRDARVHAGVEVLRVGERDGKIFVLGPKVDRALRAGHGGGGAAGGLLLLEKPERLERNRAAAIMLVDANAVRRVHALVVQLLADAHLQGAAAVVEAHEKHLLKTEEARHNLRKPMEEHLGGRQVFALDGYKRRAVPGGLGEKLAEVGDQQLPVEQEGAGKVGGAEIIQQLVKGIDLDDG